MSYFLFLFVVAIATCIADRPHIVLIIADDLGWNDVGFHGLNDIPTPNIDALAYAGLLLNRYYVTPICTPTRAALMTGKYPIHTGMQHGVIYGAEPRGLPLSEKILPQYLKELGYHTHLVGKWHLGSYKKEYLPLNRGFDSHLGFWTGRIDMYDHTSEEHGSWGFDFRRGFEVAHEYFGKYTTDIFTDESVKVIENHNASEPLFLMITHSAVHSGNPSEYIRAPDDVIAIHSNIEDYNRRKFAGVLSKLDESVGKVVKALQEKGLLKNSIVLFSTDNGGAAGGFNNNAASNYPLRGVKNTLWEGGVRGAGALFSPRLAGARAAEQAMHAADWLPTLLHAAGGNTSLENIDGLNLWPALSNDEPSPRTTVLHNIDDIFGSASITVGRLKLHKGTNYRGQWDGWYGQDGRNHSYDVQRVLNSNVGQAIKEIHMMPNEKTILELRQKATVVCPKTIGNVCNPLLAPCLFDIQNDPCEMNNLANEKPEDLQRLIEALNEMNKTAIPPNNKEISSRGDPKYWGRVYTNFGDYEVTPSIIGCPMTITA